MNSQNSIRDQILSETEEVIASSMGIFCKNSSELFQSDHFSNEDISLLHDLPYPLVYLKSIRVNILYRKQGYGKQLLKRFKKLAFERGAMCAFAKIADPETTPEILHKFYSQNNWKCFQNGRFAICTFSTL